MKRFIIHIFILAFISACSSKSQIADTPTDTPFPPSATSAPTESLLPTITLTFEPTVTETPTPETFFVSPEEEAGNAAEQEYMAANGFSSWEEVLSDIAVNPNWLKDVIDSDGNKFITIDQIRIHVNPSRAPWVDKLVITGRVIGIEEISAKGWPGMESNDVAHVMFAARPDYPDGSFPLAVVGITRYGNFYPVVSLKTDLNGGTKVSTQYEYMDNLSLSDYEALEGRLVQFRVACCTNHLTDEWGARTDWTLNYEIIKDLLEEPGSYLTTYSYFDTKVQFWDNGFIVRLFEEFVIGKGSYEGLLTFDIAIIDE